MSIPESRLENVIASVNKYLSDNYTMTAVQWPYVEFDENPISEWIKPDLLVGEGQYHRQTGGDKLGKELVVILNINIFGRREFIKLNSYRLIRIRDALRDLFRETIHIPVSDWVTGGNAPPVIGVVRCFGFGESFGGGRSGFGGGIVDITGDVFQYNISVEMRYTEQWLNPNLLN